LYFGNFISGRRNGLALEIFSNNEYYFGHFVSDLFEGEGFYSWNEKEYFFGMFEQGQKVWGRLEGQTQYQGGFKDNRRHGRGTCWYPTGEIYTGYWENGKRHGRGTIYYQDSKFEGTWVKGKRMGLGVYQTDRFTMSGMWSDEMIIEGVSLISYSNGDYFQGKTGPNLEKVEGEYISKSGRSFIGKFENDQPRNGLLVYSNKDRYQGELINNKRHGYGEYEYHSTGEVFKGYWENNLRVQ
jgi:hypothetical protein